jgi:hypothetical protein
MASNPVQANLEDGNLRTDWVTKIADVKAPTPAELNATDSFILGWYMPTDGFKLTHSQDMVDDDREASPAAGQIPGQEKFTDGELTLIDNVNKGEGSDNKAVDTLKKGTVGYIVRRRGKDVAEPYAAGDIVSVYKVTIGIKTPVAHAANARQLSTVSFSTDPNSQDETAIVTEGAGA